MTVIINGTTGTLQNYDYLVPTTGFSYTFSTCLWSAPTPMPTEGNYTWDEFTTSWVAA